MAVFEAKTGLQKLRRQPKLQTFFIPPRQMVRENLFLGVLKEDCFLFHKIIFLKFLFPFITLSISFLNVVLSATTKNFGPFCSAGRSRDNWGQHTCRQEIFGGYFLLDTICCFPTPFARRGIINNFFCCF